MLILDGRPERRGRGTRYRIVVDGKERWLMSRMFFYLAKLVCGRFIHEGGWIHQQDIEPGDLHWRYIHRLRQQSGLHIESNHQGSYRLALPREEIQIEMRCLLEFPDQRVVAALQHHILPTNETFD